MITQNKHWCRLFIVVTLWFLVTEMKTHTFPPRVEGAQQTCACSVPVSALGAPQPHHTVCWRKHGQTGQESHGLPPPSSTLQKLVHGSGRARCCTLFWATLCRAMNHVGMRKPLAAQFQKSSGTEGKAKEPVLIQRTLEMWLSWNVFELKRTSTKVKTKNSRDFFFHKGKIQPSLRSALPLQGILHHISLCTSTSHL